MVLGHPDVHRPGLELKEWVGTDAIGYNLGSEMLSATGDGKRSYLCHYTGRCYGRFG